MKVIFHNLVSYRGLSLNYLKKIPQTWLPREGSILQLNKPLKLGCLV